MSAAVVVTGAAAALSTGAAAAVATRLAGGVAAALSTGVAAGALKTGRAEAALPAGVAEAALSTGVVAAALNAGGGAADLNTGVATTAPSTAAAAAAAGAAGSTRWRTVFCTCGGLYGALVLRRLRACPELEICGIVRSSRVIDPRFGFLQGAIAQIRCSGLRYALYLWCSTTLADGLCALSAMNSRNSPDSLNGVGGNAPGRAVGPMQPGVAAALRGAEEKNAGRAADGVRRLTTRDLNDREGRAFLAACAPDLLVSSFFNQRVRAETLAIPRIAALNIHPSLLPKAKGVDPVFQSLLHGGPPLGVTVHFMNPQLDAGRILAQRAVAARVGASVFELTALLYREGAELLTHAVAGVVAGDRGIAQAGPGTYQSWPTAAETAALRRRGGALLRLMDLVRVTGGRLPRS